jgi:hypothetical protein
MLKTADQWLLVQVSSLMLALHVALRLLPFTTVRRQLDRVAGRGRRREAAARGREVEARRIIWAVRAAASRLPGTTCLIEALAADTMLRRWGHPSSLRIGVRRGSLAALDAHAWVDCNGRTVVGDTPALAEYAALSYRSFSTASQTAPSDPSDRG